ncbi:hypothetical protein FSP39_000879 [Pinctada imbricata]|uniref:BTB domain-containing protein n=1 Tax=Pinctada imbricata TaxID=66713 RepID=A0AA89C2P7_PINIB|nr:hypothetical protein FSP39_000879 [Pinctada imbricata]
MDDYYNDWQSTRTVTECNMFMFQNQIGSDVTFTLGQSGEDVVSAHKYVLCSRSSVFFAMLCGPFHSDGDDTINIPDIEKDIFLALLRFMYSEEVSITADNVTQILYAARKYSVLQLARKCRDFLEDNISTDNVSVILENAHIFDEEGLYQNCLSYIFQHPYECVQSDQFSDLCRSCFERIMGSDDLQLDEDLVLPIVMKWASKQCKKQDIPVTDENCRRVLGNLFYVVRFPIMNLQHFADNVAGNCSALTEKEKIELFMHMAGKNKSLSAGRFICRRRKPFKLVCERLGSVENASIENFRWKVGDIDKVDFSVSHNIVVLGLIIFGGRLENSTYKVASWLRNHSNDEVLGDINMKLQTTDKQTKYEILYRKPVAVKAGLRYSIHVLMKGPKTYWSESGHSSVKTQDITFTFYDNPEDSNGTSKTRGQIPGILFTRHLAETE